MLNDQGDGYKTIVASFGKTMDKSRCVLPLFCANAEHFLQISIMVVFFSLFHKIATPLVVPTLVELWVLSPCQPSLVVVLVDPVT